MGLPEKDPKDDIPPSTAELIENIDSYQRRVEEEWDAAKASYQKKINDIMEEFLQQGLSALESQTPPPPSQTNGKKPSVSPSGLEDHFESAPQRPRQPDPHVARLISQVEKELRKTRKKRQPFSIFPPQPEPFQLGWQAPWYYLTRGRKMVIGVGLGALALFMTGFFFLRTPSVVPLPYAHTLGPILSDDKMYIVDWFRKALYIHDRKKGFPILSVENLPNSLSTGIAMDGKAIWTLDSLNHKLVKHSITSDHQVQASFTTPGPAPSGLYFDGTDFWSADTQTQKLYRHRGNEVEDIRDEYPLPEGYVTALALRNNRVWLLDGKSREISVHRLQKPLKSVGIFDLDPFLEGATPTGFFVADKDVWIVTENPASVRKVSISKLEGSKPEGL